MAYARPSYFVRQGPLGEHGSYYPYLTAKMRAYLAAQKASNTRARTELKRNARRVF